MNCEMNFAEGNKDTTTLEKISHKWNHIYDYLVVKWIQKWLESQENMIQFMRSKKMFE